ncbi:MAG: AMP-binding protein [Actinobacteria bacterium]|nr:AMP-binding protein [Actinomycetota bacterium]
MDLNIAEMCRALAEAYPERECLISAGRTFTWAQTDVRTDALASVLDAVAPGRIRPFAGSKGWESTQEHVALYLHNGNEYLEGMLGAYKAAWAPVNINYRYRAAELAYVLNDSRAKAVVYHSRFAPLLDEVRTQLPELTLFLQVADGSDEGLLEGALWYEDALAVAAPLRTIELSGDDLYICYTGGTTGMPKGVLWRQADFVVSALGVRQRNGSDIESLAELVAAAERCSLRALPAPPLMHGAAHWNALSCWIAGGTIIIQDQVEHFDAADIWSTIERHGATSVLIVGDSFARPLLAELAANRYDVSSLRYVLSGGAVLSPHMKQALLDALPGITIVDVLGSSESGRQGVANTRAENAEAPGGFRTESSASIVSEDLDRVLTPNPDGDNEIGWLTQTGRVPLGYLGDEAKTARTFPVIDGVRHVVAGDRARYRADGSLELLGRDSVCINTGGEKVFAEEVEVALTSHVDVADAIVCGRDSERWGQEIVAVVATAPDATASDEDLIAHVKERLAGYKAPKAIIRVDSVVRSPSGKPDYGWARGVAASA